MKSKNDVGVNGRKGRRVRTKDGIEFTIVDDMEDLSNDPVFKKKHEDTFKFLERVGLPNFPPFED